jgi:hypothetical protein
MAVALRPPGRRSSGSAPLLSSRMEPSGNPEDLGASDLLRDRLQYAVGIVDAVLAGLRPGDRPACPVLRPAKPGRLPGRGRVVRHGRDVAFLAGELLNEEGAALAVATATVHIRSPMLRAPANPGTPGRLG